MDEIDRAQAREEQDRSIALAMRKPQLIPCGICYNCGDPVPVFSEFCDAGCCADYESPRSRASKGRQMIAARSTFVFSKAHALAKRIPVECDKKHAAHTVCERLVALLTLSQSPSPSIAGRSHHDADTDATSHNTAPQPHQSKGTPPPLPFAGTKRRGIGLGFGAGA